MGALRRNLGLVEAVALSLSIIAPTMAMSFNVTLAVDAAGRAAPLAFAIGTIALAIVGLAFVAFSRKIAHGGSAFAYITLTFGPRAGFLAGWALLLTYLVYGAGTAALVGNFADAALADYGLSVPGLWVVISATAILVAIGFAYRDMKLAARLMLVLEVLSVLAIIALGIMILTSLGAEDALTAEPFVPEADHGWSGVGYALVFAVLSFAGFEGAATLAEETNNPRRIVPIAVLATVVLAGLFYVFASYVQVVGFGLDRLDALAADPAPLDTLALAFASRDLASVLDVAAALSAFACTLGTLSAAARMLFVLGRAGMASGLAVAHPDHGTPGRAVLLLGGLVLAGCLLWAPLVGPGDYYGAMGTIGTLALILVYTSVSGAWAADALVSRRALQGFCGLIGALMMLWPLYNSLIPEPAYPANLWPYLVVAYLGMGGAVLAVRPSLTRAANGLSGG